ncbi:MAG: S53 family peptidase [Thermoprotei archaeon]
MQAKALIVLTIFLLSTLVFLYPASAAASSLTFSYYARPFFTTQQRSASLVYLGFPYPEGSPPYTPPQIAEYYGFNSMPGGGRGETIVIVDAFGSPTILQDVVVFDSYFHLPPIDLQVIKLIGPSSSTLQDREGWAMETSLDVEWAHAMAPYAKIVLVEASSDSVPALYYAVQYAIDNRLGQVVSMSWGLPEPLEETVTGPGSIGSFNMLFSQAVRDGITLVASSGDEGAYNGLSYPNVNYPASDPNVLAVGGTNLTLSTSVYGTSNSKGGLIESTAEYLWNESGGGVSDYFAEPYWQKEAGIEVTTVSGISLPSGRAVPDVSYVAISPYGPTGWAGLWIYDSTPYVFMMQSTTGHLTTYVISGWYGVGGTSCGAPQWSALVADYLSAGAMSSLITPSMYSHSRSYENYFNGVKAWDSLNNNGYYYYSRGWDAITGWGSPKVSTLITILQQ